MGQTYESARMAISSIDPAREIPVLKKAHSAYSGFHQGSGETTVAELLQTDLPRHGLILIDEIESSLHPRAQRRLIRDLAERARFQNCQIIITTHSPYILDELPLEARSYVFESGGRKQVAVGVSPQFAMTKMDDEVHPEIELYVEDDQARIFLREILNIRAKELLLRCSIIPFGAANVGMALGQMKLQNRFPRPTLVFLDADQKTSPGCILLPGSDAPERVVFEDLKKESWRNLWMRISRDVSEVSDACNASMNEPNHHDWIRSAANSLFCGGDQLWAAMCAEWAESKKMAHLEYITTAISDQLN